MQGWGGSRANEASRWGAAGHCGKGARILEGQLMFLTAYFFICFIQLLQRVQEFLWGENVRGSWEGREDSEFTYLLQPETSFPNSPSPNPHLGPVEAGRGWDGTRGPCQKRLKRHSGSAESQAEPRNRLSEPSASCQVMGSYVFYILS